MKVIDYYWINKMEGNFSLYEFKLLPDEEQYYITFNQGQFLDSYFERDRRFALYAISKFFVEVEYDVANNKIVGKISFISGPKLNRYCNLPDQV